MAFCASAIASSCLPFSEYAEGNLPIAIQFFGRHNDDLTVVKIAHAYEQVSRRRQTPASTPPLPGERFEYSVPPSKK